MKMRHSVAATLCAVIVSTATAALRGGRELQTASITKIALINADTDQEVTSADLEAGGDISLGSLPSTNLNIQAVTQGSVGKIQFNYNGQNNFRSESSAPYAFCGDSGGNYGACGELVEGTHSVTAIAFVGSQQVDSKTVNFSLVTSTSTSAPVPPGPAPTAAPQPPMGPNPTLAPVPVPAPIPSSLPWIETFAGIPNGAQSDGGATAWTATRTGGSFSVQSGEFVLNDNGSEGVLTTSPIQISGKTVDVSVDLRSDGGLETDQDYVRLFVQVDGGGEVLIGEKVGVQSSPTSISGTGISGNTIVLVIRAYVSFNNEFYFMDNLSVVEAGAGPAPVPPTPVPTQAFTPPPDTAAPVASPAPPGPSPEPPSALPWIETFAGIPNGAQSDGGATAWTAVRTGGSFSVQSGEFVLNDNGSEGVLTTSPIQISGKTVDVSVDLRSEGGLETDQDYVRLFVQVDGGGEVLIGEKVGVQSSPTSISGTGISGNTIVLVIRAYVSFNNEFYFMDNLSVFETGTGPTPVPRTPVPTGTPTSPQPPTTTPPLSLNGSWEIFQNQNIDGRHEACFVMAGDKAYLIGGRESQDVDVFDPVNRSWSKGSQAPDLLHHMQCVSVGGKIYLAAAWTGFYPQEDNADVMWVYNTVNDQWEAEQAIPEPRRRGSAAVIVDGTKIWVSHGNRGGHEQNNFATAYGWIDYYDTVSKTWVLGDAAGFPDAPNPRDHTGGALVNGRICVTGGRDGGLNNWPSVAPTDCFDPASKTWSVEASIPDNRSGSAYGTSCDGRLIVAGGERGISSRVDVFDGQNWSTFTNGLIDSRHGTGLAIDCLRNLIYIASGAPNNGGGNVKSLEIYTP